MAQEFVQIPKKELECLREHLNAAYKLFYKLGVDVGGVQPPADTQQEVSFATGVKNYKELLESGKKRTSPKHLKKRKATP